LPLRRTQRLALHPPPDLQAAQMGRHGALGEPTCHLQRAPPGAVASGPFAAPVVQPAVPQVIVDQAALPAASGLAPMRHASLRLRRRARPVPRPRPPSAAPPSSCSPSAGPSWLSWPPSVMSHLHGRVTNSWSLRSAAVTSVNTLQTHMVLPFVTSLRSRKTRAAGTSFHMVLVDTASLCGLKRSMTVDQALPSAYHGCAAGHRWPTWPGALSASG